MIFGSLYQLYRRREKYVKGKTEKERWSILNENFTTEESDDSAGESFCQ